MGPTATGKTALAVELVQRLPLAIVSVDSALVYRGMDIGTAKPCPAVLKKAPHQLVDIRDPRESFSVGEFYEAASSAIEAILSENKIPLLVGGTMLYFYALQQGIAPLPKANPVIRKQLQNTLERSGLSYLHDQLRQRDPVSAQRIHVNDPQRLLRALEVIEITGQTLSSLQANTAPSTRYRFINISILPSNRNELQQRLAQRFHDMLAQGLVEEVRALYSRGDLHAELPALRSVGYRQVGQYLSGTLTYQAMHERAIIATRQLAKRQMTWLRSWKVTQTLNMEDDTNLKQLMALGQLLVDSFAKEST